MVSINGGVATVKVDHSIWAVHHGSGSTVVTLCNKTIPKPEPGDIFPEPLVEFTFLNEETALAFVGLVTGTTLKKLEAMTEANDLCRSAYSIALRGGEKTNWGAFHARLNESLERQHKAMYPQPTTDEFAVTEESPLRQGPQSKRAAEQHNATTPEDPGH